MTPRNQDDDAKCQTQSSKVVAHQPGADFTVHKSPSYTVNRFTMKSCGKDGKLFDFIEL